MKLIDADKFYVKLNEEQIEYDVNYRGLGYAKQLLQEEPAVDNELLDYVTESIEAEKKMIGSCHDLASEDYHKGIIYAFECMKMKLM